MKSYLKFLSRNKLYTAIEALGLVVSLAFLILTGLSVRDQLHIRNTAPPGTNLHVIGPVNGFGVEYRDLEELATLPEVKTVAMYALRQFNIETDEGRTSMQVMIVDPEILDMVPHNVVSGNLDGFRRGSGVLVTESAARRLFPGLDPLTQHVTVSNVSRRGEETPTSEPVAAVIEDPDFSIFEDFDIMVGIHSSIPSVKEIAESDARRTGMAMRIGVLADMVEGFDMEAFSSKYRERFTRFDRVEEGQEMAVPYREVFFSESGFPYLRQGKSLYLKVLLILVLVLLASAVLNYINLSMASSGERAREMATRRLVGADRSSIVLKSILESLSFTFVCFLLAVLLAIWLAPVLNSLRPEGLSVPFRVSLNGPFLLLSASLILVVGVLSGLAPALFMASYRPLDIVTGQVRRKRRMTFNKVCIVFQAALSLVLTVVAISLESQLRYLERADIGVSPQKDIYFFYNPFGGSVAGLVDLMSSSPSVESIGYSTGFPTNILTMLSSGGEMRRTYSVIYSDTTAFRLMGYRLKDAFSSLAPGQVWVSEETASAVGLDSGNPDLSLIFSEDVRGYYHVNSLGGVVEDYRRIPVNAEDVYAGSGIQFHNIVIVSTPENVSGLLLKTTGNRREFEHWFEDTTRKYYRETKGLSDVFSDNSMRYGYVDDIIAEDFADLRKYARLVQIFAIVAILLAMLGLLAMSTWYASSNAKNIAVRKVFGSTIEKETERTVRSFMILTAIAAVIAVPISLAIVRRLLESYAERITGTWWIYLASTIVIFVVAYVSVLWQTLRAARTDPATELKKE